MVLWDEATVIACWIICSWCGLFCCVCTWEWLDLLLGAHNVGCLNILGQNCLFVLVDVSVQICVSSMVWSANVCCFFILVDASVQICVTYDVLFFRGDTYDMLAIELLCMSPGLRLIPSWKPWQVFWVVIMPPMWSHTFIHLIKKVTGYSISPFF